MQAGKRGDYGLAIGAFEKALEEPSLTVPQYATLQQYLCVVHKLQQNYSQALVHATRAVEAEPQNFRHRGNLANIQRDLRDFESAAHHYGSAMELCAAVSGGKAEIHRAQLRFNRALMELIQGDYARGTRGFLAKALGGKERTLPSLLHTLPRWQGEALKGRRVLVHAIEGFGDCLQWLRFLPLLKTKTGAKAVGFCPHPELSSLLLPKGVAQMQHNDFTLYKNVKVATSGAAFDIWLPLYALLFLCEARPECLPPPWQHLYPASTVGPEELQHRSFKVALVWQVNPDAPTARRRNVPLENFAPLIENFSQGSGRAHFFSLQYAAPEVSLSEALITDLSPYMTTFAHTAALLKQMDLLLSVDTVSAHLGAALGVPTRVLLPYICDWRWGLKGQTSFWYPQNFRLLRQPAPGNWGPVMKQLWSELSAWKV